MSSGYAFVMLPRSVAADVTLSGEEIGCLAILYNYVPGSVAADRRGKALPLTTRPMMLSELTRAFPGERSEDALRKRVQRFGRRTRLFSYAVQGHPRRGGVHYIFTLYPSADCPSMESGASPSIEPPESQAASTFAEPEASPVSEHPAGVDDGTCPSITASGPSMDAAQSGSVTGETGDATTGGVRPYRDVRDNNKPFSYGEAVGPPASLSRECAREGRCADCRRSKQVREFEGVLMCEGCIGDLERWRSGEVEDRHGSADEPVSEDLEGARRRTRELAEALPEGERQIVRDLMELLDASLLDDPAATTRETVFISPPGRPS